MIDTPEELVKTLIQLFPAFEEEWDDGEGYCYENKDYTFHVVFLEFGPESQKYLNDASNKEIEQFCKIINDSFFTNDDLNNAIITCFLEHSSQLKVNKILKPYLKKEAKEELR